MKTLIISAHPSSNGHVHKITKAYEEERLKLGHEVVHYELYTAEHQIPFLKFDIPAHWPDSEAIKFYQSKVTWADEIVFVHPVWWHGMPAIMKNWVDTVFQARFAFRYENGKPIGLLKGKSAKVFATAGGPSLLFTIFISPFRLTWEKMINGFCGMDNKCLLVLGNMTGPNDNMANDNFDNFLIKVRDAAEK